MPAPPFRACLRRSYRLVSVMPSSLATSATERLTGGNNFFKTAALRSCEYRVMNPLVPPPVYPSAKSAGATTILTPGALTCRFHTIGIEDLNVKGMVKNRHLSRAVSDMGFFEFRRQLDYKTAQRGGVVVVADRWYPSSKTCSTCGHKLEALPLSVREWTCPECGSVHDRDVNAAINLRNLAVSSTVSACGEEGSGSGRKTRTKPASAKQESSSKPPMGGFA